MSRFPPKYDQMPMSDAVDRLVSNPLPYGNCAKESQMASDHSEAVRLARRFLDAGEREPHLPEWHQFTQKLARALIVLDAERRAAALTAEEVEALAFARTVMEARSNRGYHEWSDRAFKLLDKLLLAHSRDGAGK